MSEPDAEALLAHILDAARQATSYIEGMAKEQFLSDSRTQQAVILNLVIIGEAATKLMDRHPEVAGSYPETEWRAMRGMRNRIAHGYYDINLDVVWETVSTALPELMDQLRPAES
jgi:uncharacterized protein with HEPN domain